MHFPETVASMTKLPPNRRLNPGSHLFRRETTGHVGTPQPDRDFIPGIDKATDIKVLSFLGETIGTPQVAQVQPRGKMGVNILVDGFDKESDERIVARKLQVASNIAKLLHHDLAYHTSDLVHLYSSEDISLDDLGHARGNVHRLPEDQNALEICHSGLTIMISDFSRKHFNANSSVFPAIAVKINHQLERSIPKNVGILALGNGYEIDTTQESERMFMNQKLSNVHHTEVESLLAGGSSVVDVVINPQLQLGFDQKAVDQQLGASVSSLR
jgi:hypothetical protein